MQHLALISFILLTAGLVFTALKLPGGLGKTFSQRVANNKNAEILYSLLFVATLPLLYLFFAIWFVPTKDVSQFFLLFAATSVVFQILCTLVPERGGTMAIIHRVLTGISVIALLPMVFIISTSHNITLGLRLFAWVALGLMFVLLAIALANQKGFRYALLLQVGYYALFFAVVLMVTYIQ
ncbi:MAG: hypothetical protein ABIR46_02600 [Candidatus Saccharimonadales bacterium]